MIRFKNKEQGFKIYEVEEIICLNILLKSKT